MNFDQMTPSNLETIYEENNIDLEDPTIEIPRTSKILVAVDEIARKDEDKYDIENYQKNPRYVGKYIDLDDIMCSRRDT